VHRAAPARKLVERQRRAANRLRRKVLEADGSLGHPYFRELGRLRDYQRAIDFNELVEACSSSDLIYVGDYHAVPGCQRFAAELLRQVVSRVPRLALGVEFIYTRQQRMLDRRQAGLLGDDDFLRRIHYREEWGYPWEGFRSLLDAARASGVAVHALDRSPRGGMAGVFRRDLHAARRIRSILEARPGTRLIVMFGESHLTPSHLPRHVTQQLRRIGASCRAVTVHQNPDAIYWLIVSRGDRPDRPVRVDETTYAVFHTTPLEKYESYRQVLERWRSDMPAEQEVDLTPAAHHLIGVLLGWLGIRAGGRRVRHRAGWVEDLVDTFPEVYTGPEALELLAPILEECGRTAEEVAEARQTLARRGSLYDSRSNVLFLLRYLPGAAAGEAARYLRAVLTGRLYIAAGDFRGDPAVRAYGGAYTEALAFIGSRLVDPASDGVDDLAACATGSLGEDARRWLEAHRLFEASHRPRPPAELLRALRRSRGLRRALARDLGRRLGRILFERVRSGRLSQRRLRGLFARPVDSESAVAEVIRLVRGELPRPRPGSD
jgi:hypothetical protein